MVSVWKWHRFLEFRGSVSVLILSGSALTYLLAGLPPIHLFTEYVRPSFCMYSIWPGRVSVGLNSSSTCSPSIPSKILSFASFSSSWTVCCWSWCWSSWRLSLLAKQGAVEAENIHKSGQQSCAWKQLNSDLKRSSVKFWERVFYDFPSLIALFVRIWQGNHNCIRFPSSLII